MTGMRRVFRHVAAVLALGSILACSGLGLCWRQFVRSAHDCCASESPTAPARPCASPGGQTTVAKVVPPALAVMPILIDLAPTSQAATGSAFAPSFPAKSPPLVLRI
jgi:hypothetical protein